MKNKIIQILRQSSPNTVSGPEISTKIGISRVAVWKHLQQLKAQGYAIQSTPKGYCLVDNHVQMTKMEDVPTGAGIPNPSDLPLPLYFPKRETSIHHFSSLTSTMDKAKSLAREGASHMSVVIAESQTKGRGRLKREWFAQEGGLWFTLILRPNLPPHMAWQVNFAASLSLARTIRQLFDIDVGVKWPNDILFNEKKLAGILSELETEGDMVSFVNIGIGLNVNNAPQTTEPRAISIKDILGRPVHRRELLADFLDRFEKTLEAHFILNGDPASSSQVDVSSLISQWKEMTITIGKRVTIQTFGETHEGVAVDVDNNGALIIEQDDGELKTIIYGDCFHQVT